MPNLSQFVDRANKIGIKSEGVQILIVIAYWMNGHTFPVGDNSFNIGTTYEPDLPVLFEPTNFTWTIEHANELERMRQAGYVKSQARGDDVYVAGRRVDWVLSDIGIHNLREILADAEPVYPPDRFNYESGTSPLFGDSFELLEHRKGVHVLFEKLHEINKLEYIKLYPNPDKYRPRPDAYFEFTMGPGRVEVITTDDDQQRWVTKWENWAKSVAKTIWVFKNRELAVKALNYLNRHPPIEEEHRLKMPNGKFGGDPSNHSVDSINKRLSHARTRAGYQSPAAHLVLTIPTALRRKDLVSILTEYFIEN